MPSCRFEAVHERLDSPVNILIVRVSSLGDVVHNMPMLADIRRHHPQANIDWVVEEAYAGLVQLNSHVRKVIPYALRRWRKNPLSAQHRAEMRDFFRALRHEAYDVVFDTQGLFKTGAVMQMARLASGGKRVGLANATEGSGYEAVSRIFHTVSVPVGLHTHAVQRARMVAAAALGYAVDGPVDFNLQAPAPSAEWLPAGPYAVFFHGTARAAKQWNADNWVQIAQTLTARGLPVLLPWGNASERHAAQLLAERINKNANKNANDNAGADARVLPALPLMDAVALAQRAALVVGVDSGLTHIAAAYRRPTIELYCDSPRWKTQGDWSDNIINLGDSGKPPSAEQVRGAIDILLGLPDSGRSASHFPR
jgi:heptosyltransferase-1